MKAKLTLSIDEELIPKAKAAARRRGKSLSEVVEKALRDISEPPKESFVDKWQGAFKLPDPEDENDPLYSHWAKKYL